jgi:hypothetical protein
MKLPNFYNFEPLNRVKERMGIPREHYGKGIDIPIHRPPIAFPANLPPTVQEVPKAEVGSWPDGTIKYGDYRVLVYIRDRPDYASLPKFHFASCTTLEEMHKDNQIDKYVVATTTDGWFDINIIGGGKKNQTKQRLDVCKNCLHRLNYKGYSHYSLTPEIKQSHVNSFSISEFFGRYPVSQIKIVPKYNSDNKPVNDYTADFENISKAYRESVHWRCEGVGCGRVLAQPQLRQYLHTHHRNGTKYDNNWSNLMALCIQCHAERPGHAQLKASVHYKAFMALNI